MKLKNRTRRKTEISTSALPDIVFLMLFFFMVTATLNKQNKDLEVQPPEAVAMTRVQKKNLVRELYVGFPLNESLGQEPRISTAEKLLAPNQIGQWVMEQKSDMPESMRDQMIVMLRADEMVSMGLISDIQEELRKANSRKVLYRTLKKENP